MGLRAPGSTSRVPARRAKKPEMLRFEKATRAGIVLAMAGVVLVALAPLQSLVRTLGGVAVVAGWALGAWGLHRYGRDG